MFDHRSEPAFEAAPPSLNDALKELVAALDALAGVDLELEDDRALLDAAVALQEARNRLDGRQLAVLEAVDRREAQALDGAVHLAAWLRTRTRQAPAESAQLVKAAVRLRRFPALRDALESGATTLRHVTTLTRQAIPRRIHALAALDDALADLAQHAWPADVDTAVARVNDALDHHDDPEPLTEAGPDERRDLTLVRGVDGLGQLFATLDPLDAEMLATLLDAFEKPDPPDTAEAQQRSAGQRRADAFTALLKAAMTCKDAGTVDGYPAMIVAVIDLLALLGLDTLAEAAHITDAHVDAIADLAAVDTSTARRIAEAALARTTRPTGPHADRVVDTPGLGQPARTPRLRFGGPTSAGVIRRLADSAKVQAVLTLGPWRAVSVGRTKRTLPPWLRTALTGIHGHCRGPDCDLPVAWCDAHHVTAWDDGGDTDLNHTIPACRRHHQTLTLGTWTATYDSDTGACTWTGPQAQTITTHPPPL